MELRQYCWFSLDFKAAGGQKQWSFIDISEMCRIYKQMARRLVNVGSIHQLISFGSRSKILPKNLQKTNVECISSAQQFCLEKS